MRKMKDACQETGLTEKTIRFYIKENLVSPQIEPGIHYRAYRFSESDIAQLKTISALRKADFSITQIKTMLTNPEEIPTMLAQKEIELKQKLDEMSEVKRALDGLTAQERTDLEKIADAILPRTVERVETPQYTKNRWLWLGIYASLFILMGFMVTRIEKMWLLGVALLFLVGVAFPIKAVSYFRYNLQWKKMQSTAVGKIIAVIPDDGVEGYWEKKGEDALHDAFSVGFLHWSWINPDHWIPQIQYEVNGEKVTAAYRYGWLKSGWKTGKEIKVGYETGKEQQIYPCSDPVIFIKAWIYLLAGVAALSLFAIIAWILLMRGG